MPDLLAEPDDVGPQLPPVASELAEFDRLGADPDSQLLVGLASCIGQLAVYVDHVF
jgi:hypothetical protein